MSNIHVVALVPMNEGLSRITVRYYNKQSTTLWATGKVRGHTKECGVCDTSLEPGTEAFRPLDNAMYRMVRLCVRCGTREKP